MTKGQPIYVFADDLTGAADAANYFRTATHRVRVSFNRESPWLFSVGPDVVQVFDSESRGLDAHDAEQRVLSAADQLSAMQSTPFLVYKKVDSTLRGQVGIEIEALLRGIKRPIAVLAPSFPANGRIVQDNQLLVDGVPISHTSFASDPRNPIVQDRVSDLVRLTSHLPVVELNHEIVALGSAAITQFLVEITHPEAIVVVDADTDEDLAAIAQAIGRNTRVLPCGSAGLAKQLAAIWADNEVKPSVFRYQVPSCTRVLLAVGSANPIAHQQLQVAVSRLAAPIVEMKPRLLAARTTHSAEMERAKQELASITNQRVVAVTLAKERAQRAPDLPGSFESDLASVVYGWVQLVLRESSNSIGFVATGGDTALALCQALSASALWPEGELVPGIPWSWIETGHVNLPLISKAGGFGDLDALHTAATYLMT